MIGNSDCRFNALSSVMRCAVNPDGPCHSCSHFEQIADPQERRIRSLQKTIYLMNYTPQLTVSDRIQNIYNAVLTTVLACIAALIFGSFGSLYLRVFHFPFTYSPTMFLLKLAGPMGCLVFGILSCLWSFRVLAYRSCWGGECPPFWFERMQSFKFFTGMILGYLFLKSSYIGFSRFIL
jgi:Family of unknown function (DUF6464)